MIQQKEFKLPPKRKGCHLVTHEILRELPSLPQCGLLHLFIKHTSAALSINENADPDVQTDLNQILNHFLMIIIKSFNCIILCFNMIIIILKFTLTF